MQTSFDWNDLKFFLELARQKKMVTAAKRLRVDHTTVSRRITALEEEIGAKLFFKNEKGYQLTRAGERLMPIALQIENATEQASEDIGGEARRVEGTVRVGATDALGTFFIAPKLSRFQETHPELRVDLVVLPQYFNLSLREAQISVTLARPTAGRLLARKLTDYTLQFFASKSYVERFGRPERRRDLRNHRVTGYIDDMVFAPELRYMDDFPDECQARFRSSSIIAQMQAVASGSGIGILPSFLGNEDERLVPVLTDDYLITRTLWLLSHQDTANLVRIRAVSDYLQAEAKKAKDYFVAR